MAANRKYHAPGTRWGGVETRDRRHERGQRVFERIKEKPPHSPPIGFGGGDPINAARNKKRKKDSTGLQVGTAPLKPGWGDILSFWLEEGVKNSY